MTEPHSKNKIKDLNKNLKNKIKIKWRVPVKLCSSLLSTQQNYFLSDFLLDLYGELKYNELKF